MLVFICSIFLLFASGMGVAVSQESVRYVQLYGGALVSHQAEVENLDPLFGIGGAMIAVPEGGDWGSRLALEYFRAEQEDDFGIEGVSSEATHQVIAGYLEFLYSPSMAAAEESRFYIGPGIGFMYENLKFETEYELGGETVTMEGDFSGSSFLLTGSIGAQFGILDLMWRLVVPTASDNVTLGSVFSVGVALGPL